jgi:Leucine-rich repeat (LRR) protein
VLELDQVPVLDLSPLEGMNSLVDVSFSFGEFIDILPLTRLPNLTRFHVYGCPNINYLQMVHFRYLTELTILHPDHTTVLYRYLPKIPLRYLNVEESSIDSFEWFSASKDSLETLHLHQTKFTSLKGIEDFTELRVLYISRTGITDLTPLLTLPNLKEVYISSDMMEYFNEIRDAAQFEVFVY